MQDISSTHGAPALSLAEPEPRHVVQFYEDEAFLCESVVDFVLPEIRAGRPALLIATAAHLEAIGALLAEHGLEVARARVAGLLTLLDARETLSQFMVNGLPDPARFRRVVGDALDLACRERPGTTLAAFGEMVDLLWRDGNPAGALALEALWNELAAEHSFVLLCGYDISNFDQAEDSEGFLHVCRAHTHAIPTEKFSRLSTDERQLRVAELEQRARALETELAYRRRLELRLRAVAAEAAAANRAKSEFLAVMSHELRTPLNAIGGYAELLEMGLRGPITEQQRQDIQRIQGSQRHLLGLVNEVLNYAKLETGAVKYDLADVPAREALTSAEGLIAPMARAKGLRFRVVPCAEGLQVRADAEKLRQILVNLLSNAVKFTTTGGEVTLQCEQDDDHVRFVVRDTGIGIPAPKLEVIFEPFVQVRSDLTREFEGTGLGLSISRAIAEAMGGSLRAESVEGRGSQFTLRLPPA